VGFSCPDCYIVVASCFWVSCLNVDFCTNDGDKAGSWLNSISPSDSWHSWVPSVCWNIYLWSCCSDRVVLGSRSSSYCNVGGINDSEDHIKCDCIICQTALAISERQRKRVGSIQILVMCAYLNFILSIWRTAIRHPSLTWGNRNRRNERTSTWWRSIRRCSVVLHHCSVRINWIRYRCRYMSRGSDDNWLGALDLYGESGRAGDCRLVIDSSDLHCVGCLSLVEISWMNRDDSTAVRNDRRQTCAIRFCHSDNKLVWARVWSQSEGWGSFFSSIVEVVDHVC